jgi:hypothetical protein
VPLAKDGIQLFLVQHFHQGDFLFRRRNGHDRNRNAISDSSQRMANPTRRLDFRPPSMVVSQNLTLAYCPLGHRRDERLKAQVLR